MLFLAWIWNFVKYYTCISHFQIWNVSARVKIKGTVGGQNMINLSEMCVFCIFVAYGKTIRIRGPTRTLSRTYITYIYICKVDKICWHVNNVRIRFPIRDKPIWTKRLKKTKNTVLYFHWKNLNHFKCIFEGFLFLTNQTKSDQI